jgi:hypothetical protein
VKLVLLVGGVGSDGRAFLFELRLLHDDIEVAVSKLVVFGYFVGGADGVLAAFGVAVGVFVGEKEVKLYLGIVDGIGVYYLAEVVPFTHHLFVLGNEGHNGFLEEGTEGLHQLSFSHYYYYEL